MAHFAQKTIMQRRAKAAAVSAGITDKRGFEDKFLRAMWGCEQSEITDPASHPLSHRAQPGCL